MNNDGIFKQLPEIRKNGSLYECIRELIDKTLSNNGLRIKKAFQCFLYAVISMYYFCFTD